MTDNTNMKLKEIVTVTGKIVLKTGLHIGAGDTDMHIGGTDHTVVRNALTGDPYIPGSSLKGKIRSLLEYEVGVGENPLSSSSLPSDNGMKTRCTYIIKLFGSSDANDDLKEPTRLLFSDCALDQTSKEQCYRDRIPLTEIKAENSINRRTGAAGNLRVIERVIPGVSFNFSITLRVFEGDPQKEFEDILLRGISLLEHDYLGGNGSRGYGKVRFELDNQKLGERLNEIREKVGKQDHA